MTDKKYEFTSKMPADIKRKWLKALRSGDFSQTKNALENKDGNCCLGVLCRVLEVPVTPAPEHDNSGRTYFAGAAGYLPPSILEQIGLTDEDQHTLSYLNDGNYSEANGKDKGKSFKTIARIIERNIRVQRKGKNNAA